MKIHIKNLKNVILTYGCYIEESQTKLIFEEFNRLLSKVNNDLNITISFSKNENHENDNEYIPAYLDCQILINNKEADWVNTAVYGNCGLFINYGIQTLIERLERYYDKKDRKILFIFSILVEILEKLLAFGSKRNICCYSIAHAYREDIPRLFTDYVTMRKKYDILTVATSEVVNKNSENYQTILLANSQYTRSPDNVELLSSFKILEKEFSDIFEKEISETDKKLIKVVKSYLNFDTTDEKILNYLHKKNSEIIECQPAVGCIIESEIWENDEYIRITNGLITDKGVGYVRISKQNPDAILEGVATLTAQTTRQKKYFFKLT